MRRKAAVLLCALAAAVVITVPAAHGANAAVSIVDYNFQPGSVTVNVGESVTWTHKGTATHTVSGNGFDSGNLTTGQMYTYTFSQAGSFAYHCNIHPSMTGTVNVVGSAPPPTQPPTTAAPSPSPAAASPATAAAPRATTAPPTTAATTTSTSSTTTTIAPPAAAAGTTSSTLAAAGGGVALPAQKTSSGSGDDLSPWLVALAVVLVLGAGAGGILLRRRFV